MHACAVDMGERGAISMQQLRLVPLRRLHGAPVCQNMFAKWFRADEKLKKSQEQVGRCISRRSIFIVF